MKVGSKSKENLLEVSA